MTQTHTDHVDAATARKLRDLGAFAERKLRVGDWVWLEGREFLYVEDSFEPIAPGNEAEPLMVLRPANSLDPLWESASPGECLFLPRLADLLDELEYHGHHNIYFKRLKSGYRCCAEWPALPPLSIVGKTREESAANCLIAVLETRKEKSCDKK